MYHIMLEMFWLKDLLTFYLLSVENAICIISCSCVVNLCTNPVFKYFQGLEYTLCLKKTTLKKRH